MKDENVKYNISLPCFIKKEGNRKCISKPLLDCGVQIRSYDGNTTSISLKLIVPDGLLIDCVKKGEKYLELTIKDGSSNAHAYTDEISPEEWKEMCATTVKDFWDAFL